MGPIVRDLLRSLSFGNLCFFAIWSELERARMPGVSYYHRHPAGAKQYGAVALDVLIVASLVCVGARLVRISGRRLASDLARGAFLVALVAPLGALRTELSYHLDYVGLRWLDRLMLVCFLLMAAGTTRQLLRGACLTGLVETWARRGAVVLMITSPFLLVTFGRAIEMVARGEARERPSLPRLEPIDPERPRVVWLLFDELDRRAALEEAPTDLPLPELGRLRSGSVDAAQATSPADWTLVSLPSLLTGRLVKSANPLARDELGLAFATAPDALVPWSGQDNVLRAARELGVNTALAGWYHPYPRVLGDSTTDCAFEPCHHETSLVLMDYQRPLNFLDHQVGAFVSALPWGKMVRTQRLLKNWRGDRVSGHERLLGLTTRAAVDPEIGLVFAHFAPPHLSAIWDRRRDSYRWEGEGDYWDNLALVDRTLGQLRRSMEAAGTWDRTAVIVTSDHHWRGRPGDEATARDHRVPFIIKLPYQTEGIVHAAPFQTLATRALVLEVLSGRVITPEDAAAWMSQHIQGP